MKEMKDEPSVLHQWILSLSSHVFAIHSVQCSTACFYRGVTVLPHSSSDSTLPALSVFQR